MTVAIIGAYQFDESGRRLATLPIAGMPLVERQARNAAASAHPIYLLGEGNDAALADIVGRLVRDGIDAHAVDGLPTAADQIALDTPVLLVADGCLADADLMARVCEAQVPTLAVVADLSGRENYERIDANARWAGVALIDGKRVGDTAAMLGSWDAVSTMLRRAVQENAGRIEIDGMLPALALDATDAAAVEDTLYEATLRPPRDWVERFVLHPIEGRLLPLLLSRQIRSDALADAGALTALAGGALSLAGVKWPALVALLLTAPVTGMAERMSRLHARPIKRARLHHPAILAGATLATVGLGLQLMVGTHQWGWLLLAAVLIASLLLLAEEKGEAPAWVPRPITMPWPFLPFALIGRWGTGLAALALWSVGTIVAGRIRRHREHRQRLPTGT